MIKLLIGGSPCTKWSIAQKKDREVTATDNKPITNADRIRSMTDAELAKELWRFWIEFETEKIICSDRSCEDVETGLDSKCVQCILDWLQQPYKEWGKCDRFFIDDGGQCAAPSCWDTDKRDYRIGVKCGGDKAKCCLSDQYT